MSDPVTRLREALEGRYRIERQLGEGGMATVYLAEDLKHERSVALKVLKPELAAVVGGERFLAEIKTTANLQHPHILALFDSGEADGFLFYVMPYVDGESLRDRLDREKQLPVEEAVRIAAGIAAALDYAHRHGVIHRDIKPANILLHDGQPVVADFGIALAISAAGGGRLTETGLSLGTPHYMSPEQATADRDLSPQSDIYALACVTYEMLAGSPPFAAPTAQAILMKILTEDADPVTAVRRSVPDHVEWAVSRALEKLPADRFPSAEAFGKALTDPSVAADQGARTGKRGIGSGRGGRGSGRRGRDSGSGDRRQSALTRFVWPAVAIVAGVLAVIGFSRDRSDSREVVRFVLQDRGGSVNAAALSRTMTMSPDGGSVAYVAPDPSGSLGIFVQDLDRLEPRILVTGNITTLAYSPDGSSMAFVDRQSIKTIPVAGGPSTTVARGVETPTIAWSEDGNLYFSVTDEGRNRIARVRADGGDVEVLWDPGETGLLLTNPLPLPDGRSALVNIQAAGATGEAYVASLDFEASRLDTLQTGQAAQLVQDRYLFFVSADGDLVGAPFDAGSRSISGAGITLVQGLDARPFVLPQYAISALGDLVYQEVAGEALGGSLIRVHRSGEATSLAFGLETSLGFRLSPEGDRIAYEVGGASDVYVMDLASGTPTRITFDALARYPTFTPDGTRVAYFRNLGERTALFWKNADGSGVEEPLLQTDAFRPIEVAFLPDGRRMIVRGGDQSRGDSSDLLLFEIGSETGIPIADTEGTEVSPAISPDGRYLAYTSSELGTEEVFVRSIDNPRERWQISTNGGREPVWHPEGTEIFFRTDVSLHSVPVSLDGAFRTRGVPQPLFPTDSYLSNSNHAAYAVLPDGDTFLFLDQRTDARTIVVLNWLQEVRDRLEPQD